MEEHLPDTIPWLRIREGRGDPGGSVVGKQASAGA